MVIDRDTTQGPHEMFAYSHPLISRTAFLNEIASHQEQDRVLQGTYWDWETGKGCAIGCAFNSIASLTADMMVPDERDNHRLLSKYLGIDPDLLRVEDGIFEALPEERARVWPMQFSSAIQTGAATSGVVFALIAAVMRGLYAPAIDTPPAWAAIGRRVAAGIAAGWKIGEWLYLRTEYPDEDYPLPARAVTYILAKHRGETFLTRDALISFMWGFNRLSRTNAEWMADALLVLLRDLKPGVAEAA